MSHDHDHEPAADESGPWSEYQYLEAAMRELLIEKGVVTADQIRAQMEKMDGRSPAMGARVVAKAWTDPDYKARLFTDANAAIDELGIDIQPTHLVALENTEEVHNVVVCTLCSCYPRNLLGLPPAWYKASDYRSRVVREPRRVLGEFGTELTEAVQVRVHDSTADMRYIVIPKRPAGTDDLSEDALAELVNRDSMIGVTVVQGPA
ncbi:MAG: nitrile hydratase subunit alpha [Alphaproteobacteria bacterium]|jgi:nitrile hydratase|nr:nitrile hydratase subunit alpha [Alphaproteobacteria bacterium]